MRHERVNAINPAAIGLAYISAVVEVTYDWMDTPYCALESSGATASLAIVTTQGTVTWESKSPRTHAEELAPALSALLRTQQLQPSDLRAIGFSSGPGSYTGLRIGAALAYGMSLGCGIPTVAVPTMHAIAWRAFSTGIWREHQTGFTTLASRKGYVYVGAFEMQDGLVREKLAPSSSAIEELGALESALATAERPICRFGYLGAPCLPTAADIAVLMPLFVDIPNSSPEPLYVTSFERQHSTKPLPIEFR